MASGCDRWESRMTSSSAFVSSRASLSTSFQLFDPRPPADAIGDATATTNAPCRSCSGSRNRSHPARCCTNPASARPYTVGVVDEKSRAAAHLEDRLARGTPAIVVISPRAAAARTIGRAPHTRSVIDSLRISARRRSSLVPPAPRCRARAAAVRQRDRPFARQIHPQAMLDLRGRDTQRVPQHRQSASFAPPRRHSHSARALRATAARGARPPPSRHGHRDRRNPRAQQRQSMPRHRDAPALPRRYRSRRESTRNPPRVVQHSTWPSPSRRDSRSTRRHLSSTVVHRHLVIPVRAFCRDAAATRARRAGRDGGRSPSRRRRPAAPPKHRALRRGPATTPAPVRSPYGNVSNIAARSTRPMSYVTGMTRSSRATYAVASSPVNTSMRSPA